MSAYLEIFKISKMVASLLPGTWLTFFNPHSPVAQKIVDEVVFRRFQGEGVEFFFQSDLTDQVKACKL